MISDASGFRSPGIYPLTRPSSDVITALVLKTARDILTRRSTRSPSFLSILEGQVIEMQLILKAEQLLLAPVAAAVPSFVYVLYKILSQVLQSPKSVSNGKATSPPTAESELFDGNFDTTYTVQGNILVTDGLAKSTYRILRLLGVLALTSLHIFCVSTEYLGVSSTKIGYALLAFYASSLVFSSCPS